MLSLLAGGNEWMPQTLLGLTSADPACWVEPARLTAMLMPAPIYSDWTSSTTGICAKYGYSDYTLSDTTAAHWLAHSPDTAGGFLQYSVATGNTSGVYGSLPTQPTNQGMVVELFWNNTTASTGPAFECGWSNTGNGSVGVSLRFYLNGQVEIWKNGGLVGTGSITVNEQSGKDAYGNQGYILYGQLAATARGYVTIMLIPYRDRELLVHSSAGGAFAHVFLDLAEGVADQTITDNAAFWFNIPAPQTPSFRISQLQFASSGTLYSRTTQWRNAPPAGMGGADATPNFTIYQSLSQAPANLVAPSVVVAAYNPYGLTTPRQFSVALSIGTGSYAGQSPFLYGVRAWYERVMTESAGGGTGGAGVDATDYLIGASLMVGDTVSSGASMRMTFKNPSDMDAAGIPLIETMAGREIQISDASGIFLESVADAPEWTDGYSDETVDVTINARDDWKLAEEYTFADPVPLDGLSLADAYSLIVDTIGGSVTLSTAADSVYIGNVGSTTSGEWACLIEVGDRASTWLERLHTTYAGNWAHYIDRNGNFCLQAPSDMPSTSSITLYRTQADAIAAGVSSANAYKQVYRASHRIQLEPEANEVWVTGQEIRTSRPIVVGKRIADSVDPTVAPADRASNWLGRLKKYAFGDPSLTTPAACIATRDLLVSKLTVPRFILDVECEYLDGLWKGDLITLASGDIDGSDLVCRIKTIKGNFVQVGSGMTWRPCTYVVEAGALVAPLGVSGLTSEAIKANKRTAEKQMQQSDIWEDLSSALKNPKSFVQLDIS